MSPAPPLVRIVDDQPSVRESLADLLASVGMATRGYGSVLEFRRDDDPACPGCLLLDVRMPESSGFELVANFTQDADALPFVFITGHGDVAMAVRAMKLGAVDFLTKPFNDQYLIDAVNAALRLDRERRAAAKVAAEARGRFSSLSEGETDVLRLTIRGQKIKQIAASLAISEITVKVRRARIFQKLGTSSFLEIVQMSIASGMESQMFP